jgi:MarR family transcriptional regulator, organic hydroperoxide resistance regulator
LSLGELGALLIAEGGHPSRLVDRLVEAGLAHRQQAEHDRRQIEISCTALGSELAARAAERKDIFTSWVRERMQGQDVAAASALLQACLRDTALGETVRQRRDRPINVHAEPATLSRTGPATWEPLSEPAPGSPVGVVPPLLEEGRTR